MAQLLASLFSIDINTVLIIFVLCTGGSLVIKSQLEDPMISFAFQPVLALLSVLIYAGLAAGSIIEPLIITDWIKGIMVAAMVGNAAGIGLILLLVALFSERNDNRETELLQRQPRPPRKSPGVSSSATSNPASAPRKRKGFG